MEALFQHLINGLSLGSIYALIALGYTLVYGILKLINFAHGDLFMLSAYVAMGVGVALGLGGAQAFDAVPQNHWLAFSVVLIASMLFAAAAGWLVERYAYRPLRGQPRLNLLITAVGVSLLFENAVQAWNPNPQKFPDFIIDSTAFQWGTVQISRVDLVVLATTLGLLAALEYWVHKTRQGRAMRAVSHSHDTATLLGIPVNRTIAITFAVGSALAAAAAVLYGCKYPKVDPLMGVLPGIKAFVAAVLGGIGNLRGAVVGGLILGLAETLVSAYGASTWRDALAFGLLIVILLFKPAGLFGRYERERV